MDLAKKLLMAVVALALYGGIIYVGRQWQEEEIVKTKKVAIEQVRDEYIRSLDKIPAPRKGEPTVSGPAGTPSSPGSDSPLQK
jgi:hypothetical protein